MILSPNAIRAPPRLRRASATCAGESVCDCNASEQAFNICSAVARFTRRRSTRQALEAGAAAAAISGGRGTGLAGSAKAAEKGEQPIRSAAAQQTDVLAV